jgi:hypothetical protein
VRVLIVVAFVLVVAGITLADKAHDSRVKEKTRCEKNGGEYRNIRGESLCLRKGTTV